MNILLLRGFNNYFNRIVKKYSTLADYTANSDDYVGFDSINFNPNDGVNSALVIGNVNQKENNLPLDWENIGSPDYLVCYENEGNPATSVIKSRWFVTNSKRTRNGQYELTLRRDVIADNLENLTLAPVYVQKGWLQDTNHLILNSEGMNFNKIKTSETLLKDNTGVPWYVAYLSKNKGGTSISVQTPAEDLENTVNLAEIADSIGISEGRLSSLLNFDSSTNIPAWFINRMQITFYLRGSGTNLDGRLWCERDVKYGGTESGVHLGYNAASDWVTDTDGDIWPLFIGGGVSGTVVVNTYQMGITANRIALQNQLATIMNVPNQSDFVLTEDQLNILTQYNFTQSQKYVYYLGNYYKLNISTRSTSWKNHRSYFGTSEFSSLQATAQWTSNYAAQQGYAFRLAGAGEGTSGVGYLGFNTYGSEVYIQLNKVSDDDTIPVMNLTISSARKQTIDQQYDVICFPANDIRISFSTLLNSFISEGETCRKMLVALGVQEDANVYDIQLLPYCPLPLVTTQGRINISSLILHTDYDYIVDSQEIPQKHGIVFYVRNASISIPLNYNITTKDSLKVDNECDMYRLIAPNYQGSFDFNVAKNGGSIDGFTAYCTFKPYTPFIKVTPNFNSEWLYGTDYNDNRGLICSGDFSLGRYTDAWEQYQLNNKNYQNIFNREIQNLEFNQSIEDRQRSVTGGIGIVTDSLKGSMAGAMVGGWVGAIVGGVAGTATSTAGYIIDQDIMHQQHREQKSFAIDKFNYQLGNIKALPYTLTKVGAFDISSKIWPVVEYYTCTDEEKEALKSKLEYESMTVMTIGKFGDYYQVDPNKPRYFKGELIRCEEVNDDTHIIEALYTEINKGVYM